MKTIAWIAFIGVLLFLGIVQSGCGSRKVQSEISNKSEKTDEGSKDKGSEEAKTESKSESKETNKADKTEEVVTTTTVDELNDKGEVIKRTQSTKTERRVDRSVNDKSASEQLKTFSYKTWVKTYWKIITIRTKEKSKDVSVSNLGWIVAVVVLGGLASLFGFLYAKTKRKLVNATSVF